MKKLLIALLASLPLSALAADRSPPNANPNQTELRDEMEKHTRLARVVGLAEELDLNTNEALRVDEVLRKYDERRRPLREQVAEAAKILERAADGDTQAQGQVDQAAQRIFEARTQMAELDKEMFQQLARDLRPQQRAKMAVFFARYDNANVEKRIFLRKRLGGGEDGMINMHKFKMKLRGIPGMEHDVDMDD